MIFDASRKEGCTWFVGHEFFFWNGGFDCHGIGNPVLEVNCLTVLKLVSGHEFKRSAVTRSNKRQEARVEFRRPRPLHTSTSVADRIIHKQASASSSITDSAQLYASMQLEGFGFIRPTLLLNTSLQISGRNSALAHKDSYTIYTH